MNFVMFYGDFVIFKFEYDGVKKSWIILKREKF